MSRIVLSTLNPRYVHAALGLRYLVANLEELEREARFHADVRGATLAGAYVMGLAFAFGWTPCIGPVLATVLTLAASEGTLVAGVRLLFVYSLGLGLPFILAAMAIGPFVAFLQRFRKHLGRVEMVMGLFFFRTLDDVNAHFAVRIATALAVAKTGGAEARKALDPARRVGPTGSDAFASHIESRMAVFAAMGLLPADGDQALLLHGLGMTDRRDRRAAAG